MKYNPFRPNAPIPTGMFAGRASQLDSLRESLFQTRAGNSCHFMMVGERGIGKTSLLRYFKYLAEGTVPIQGEKFNFLVLEVDIEINTTKYSLIKRIERAFQRKLITSNRADRADKARAYLKDTWSFLTRFEAAGIKLNAAGTEMDFEIMLDDFAYSFSETVKRITSNKGKLFEKSFDGVVILVDEADSCGEELDLGTFLKLLLERAQRNDCNNLLIGLAGLPALHKILTDSHPSSLRLFNRVEIDRLNSKEVRTVITRCLQEAKRKNDIPTTIDKGATDILVDQSEGFPHFIQQFGFSAFARDTDDNIDINDVIDGMLGEHGAIELIGDRYYRNDFYNKTKSPASRQVLRIMSDESSDWVQRSTIKDKFVGNPKTMDTAIKLLCDKNVIVRKEGESGVYRLQQRAFATWIKYYTGTETASLLGKAK